MDQWITLDWEALGANFWSATVDGLTFGGIYALVALGYTLVYGVLNLINFAHSEVFIVGAYAIVFTLTSLGFGPSVPNLAWYAIAANLLLAVVFGMLASAITAFIVERVAYKPLRDKGAPRLVFLISAIGMSFGANAGYAINPARDFGPRFFAWIAGWGKVAIPGNYGNVDGYLDWYYSLVGEDQATTPADRPPAAPALVSGCQVAKFASRRNPASWLFSGWNCTAKMFALAAAHVNANG